jgi:leader peptidase (prepilin peptidase)/N-methyltransferase
VEIIHDFETIIVVLFGLIMGSFYNVLIYRLPREINVVFPRSKCPHCEHIIPWYFNIPVISYILLRGKCHYCGKPISVRYPIVESLTSLFFYFSFIKFGLTMEFGATLLFGSLFFILFWTDIDVRILPDELTIGGSVLAVLYSFFRPDLSYKIALIGALIGFMIFIGSYLFFLKVKKKEGLGWGDIKLIILIGALFGPFKMLLIIILSSLLGILIWGFIALLFKKGREYELPFGSFLGLVSLIFLFYGDKIVYFYNNFLI